MVRKIDQLKQILESQEKGDDWTYIGPCQLLPGKGTLELVVLEEEISFVFDETGEKLLGIVNWKE